MSGLFDKFSSLFVLFDFCGRISPLMNMKNDTLLIQPEQLSLESAKVEKIINISKLGRLHPYLGKPEGQINVAFQVKAKPYDGRLLLSLQLNGQLTILCQRCNEAYEWPLAMEASLLIEDGKSQSIQIDKEYEVVTTDDRGELDMLSIITDEIVLGLPFAHDGECQNTHYRKYVYNAAKAHTQEGQSSNLGEL